MGTGVNTILEKQAGGKVCFFSKSSFFVIGRKLRSDCFAKCNNRPSISDQVVCLIPKRNLESIRDALEPFERPCFHVLSRNEK